MMMLYAYFELLVFFFFSDNQVLHALKLSMEEYEIAIVYFFTLSYPPAVIQLLMSYFSEIQEGLIFIANIH